MYYKVYELQLILKMKHNSKSPKNQTHAQWAWLAIKMLTTGAVRLTRIAYTYQ